MSHYMRFMKASREINRYHFGFSEGEIKYFKLCIQKYLKLELTRNCWETRNICWNKQSWGEGELRVFAGEEVGVEGNGGSEDTGRAWVVSSRV